MLCTKDGIGTQINNNLYNQRQLGFLIKHDSRIQKPVTTRGVMDAHWSMTEFILYFYYLAHVR